MITSPSRMAMPTNGRHPAPRVVLHTDHDEPEPVLAQNLTKADLEAWRHRIAEDEAVHLRIEGWAHWPPAARWTLLSLLTELAQPTVTLAIEIEGAIYDDPFEATVGALAGPGAPLAAQRNTREAAIEAAALGYPTTPELPSARINQRLTDLGAPLIDDAFLRRQIRGRREPSTSPEPAKATAPSDRTRPGADAKGGTADKRDAEADAAGALAEAYLAQQRERAGLGAGEPVLWFFRQRWYRWRPPAWRAIEQAELRAAVTRFLYGHQVAVTPSLIDRVMLSLQADCLLPCHDTDPPFAVDPETRRPAFRCPNHIGVPNGILDLAELKGKLRPLWQTTPPEELALPLMEPDPSYLITKTLPVRYDPEATCPKWDELLTRMLPREPPEPKAGGDQRREVLAEYIFSLLVGGWPANHWLILLGGAEDGRPFVLKVISGLLGEPNVSRVPLSRLGKGTHIEALEGKLANISTELAPPGDLDETVVRQIVMGEPVQLGRNRREATTGHPTARLVMACDDTGLFIPRDRLLRERLILMPFEGNVWEDGVVPDLAEQLIAEEGPGILNWVLRGGARLLDRSGRVTECHACSQAYVRGLEVTDPMERFLDEMCEWNVYWGVYRNVLYQVFCRFWRTRLGRQDRPMNEAEFGKALRAAATARSRPIGDTRTTMNNGARPRMYVGLTLSAAGEWVWHECDGSAALDLRL